MDTILTCRLCACLRLPDARDLTWSSHHGPHATVYLCGPCTRTHLPDLECGLFNPTVADRPAAATDGRRAA